MSARVLFLELAARGVNMRSDVGHSTLRAEDALTLHERVRTDRVGLLKILRDLRDADLREVRGEVGA